MQTVYRACQQQYPVAIHRTAGIESFSFPSGKDCGTASFNSICDAGKHGIKFFGRNPAHLKRTISEDRRAIPLIKEI
jgi:hypothetical protein